MPSKLSVMLRSAPFETPPAAAPQDKLARLEGRRIAMHPALYATNHRCLGSRNSAIIMPRGYGARGASRQPARTAKQKRWGRDGLRELPQPAGDVFRGGTA